MVISNRVYSSVHVMNSEDVSSWFGKYFRSPQHKTYLEHHSFTSILVRPHGLKMCLVVVVNFGNFVLPDISREQARAGEIVTLIRDL